MTKPARFTNTIIWTVVSFVAAAAASPVATWAWRTPTNDPQFVWILSLAILLALSAVGLQIWLKISEYRRGATVEKAREIAQKQISDELRPIAYEIATMASVPHADRHHVLRNAANMVAVAMRSLASEHASEPRACVYFLNPDAQQMESVATNGRRTEARPFIKGTKRGDSALKFVKSKRVRVIQDAPKQKPEGYDGATADYESFVSVPIWTDNGVYGMITVDSPKTHSFTEGDVAMLQLLADLLGDAHEVAQDYNTRKFAARTRD